jgi:hypothetical protein
VVISRWEKEVTPEQLHANLRHAESITDLVDEEVKSEATSRPAGAHV